MATPTKAPQPTFTDFVASVREGVKPYLVPYYLTIGAVLGGITVGFAVLIVLIILVVTNFNVLSLIE